MPPPLPRPLNDLMGHVQSNRASNTATLPYPTQQAITTTPAALVRGDWGLKRALPLKATTKTSTPFYRINAVDTREHITDFESASDLTLTLQKLQELNLPITTRAPKTKATIQEPRISVFDSSKDYTDPDGDARIEGQSAMQKERWKFHGPWLAGMNEGEFQDYVANEVVARKEEFREMLRDTLRREARRKARHEGVEVEEAVAEAEITDEDLEQYIKTLREDRFVLGPRLAAMIEKFLDLPPLLNLNNSRSSATNEGPPQTHPSAGLSYIMSDAHLENHPRYGPQRSHSPVESRILVGVSGTSSVGNHGVVGIAGVATTAPQYSSGVTNNPRIRSTPGTDESHRAEERESTTTIGVETQGGNRLWITPVHAQVDTRGRLGLKVANPDRTAVHVHTGRIEEVVDIPQPRRTLDTAPLPSFLGMPQLAPRARSAATLGSAGKTPFNSSTARNPHAAVSEILQ